MTNRMKKVFAVMVFALVIFFSTIISIQASEDTSEELYQNAVQIWQIASPDLAIAMWEEIAIEYNHIPSMWALTIAYMQGVKVDRDISKVIKWLTKLSDIDYADAKEMLGDMYYYGRGVPQNYETAFKWYTNYLQIERDPDILMRYATLLATGQGTPKNLVEAWKIFREARFNEHYAISAYTLARMTYLQMNLFEQFKIKFFIKSQQNN